MLVAAQTITRGSIAEKDLRLPGAFYFDVDDVAPRGAGWLAADLIATIAPYQSSFAAHVAVESMPFFPGSQLQ